MVEREKPTSYRTSKSSEVNIRLIELVFASRDAVSKYKPSFLTTSDKCSVPFRKRPRKSETWCNTGVASGVQGTVPAGLLTK